MMAAASHNPVFAKKVGVPLKVAKEFNVADTKSGFLKSAMRAKGPAYKDGGSVDERASDLMDAMDRDAAKRAADAKAAEKKPTPRSDKRNPDRGTITPRVYDTPPQYAKGGGVKGRGIEKRGIRPAKYY